MKRQDHIGLQWAVKKWEEQVKDRPLRNAHRATLDDVWRQVIRFFGGDDRSLCGPTHQELLTAHTPPMKTESLDRLEREIIETLGNPNSRYLQQSEAAKKRRGE